VVVLAGFVADKMKNKKGEVNGDCLYCFHIIDKYRN
jgi:hypothetical protein